MRADTSSLTLDDVGLAFDRNFNFTQGRLFMFNDVLVTGTNTFVYASIKPLYIEPFSRLYFDLGTTFSYSPYEHRPHRATDRDLLRLVNRTSQIVFDGCTVNLPDAGLRLTCGTLCFDNKVEINTDQVLVDSAHSFELGDGASDYTDVDVKVLSGANVRLNGFMYHNPSI
jgi:hypothetical protein